MDVEPPETYLCEYCGLLRCPVLSLMVHQLLLCGRCVKRMQAHEDEGLLLHKPEYRLNLQIDQQRDLVFNCVVTCLATITTETPLRWRCPRTPPQESVVWSSKGKAGDRHGLCYPDENGNEAP